MRISETFHQNSRIKWVPHVKAPATCWSYCDLLAWMDKNPPRSPTTWKLSSAFIRLSSTFHHSHCNPKDRTISKPVTVRNPCYAHPALLSKKPIAPPSSNRGCRTLYRHRIPIGTPGDGPLLEVTDLRTHRMAPSYRCQLQLQGFGTLTANIRQRRGSKVDIRMPLFQDLRQVGRRRVDVRSAALG